MVGYNTCKRLDTAERTHTLMRKRMHGVQGVDGTLVGLDCHNKIPHPGGLNKRCLSHNSGGWEAQD